jgi:hypothetical protein
MSKEILREIIEKAAQLTTEEQLHLIDHLRKKTAASRKVETAPRRKWSDIVGMLQYPACGEDAQDFISRSRREADAKRLGEINE